MWVAQTRKKKTGGVKTSRSGRGDRYKMRGALELERMDNGTERNGLASAKMEGVLCSGLTPVQGMPIREIIKRQSL